MSRINYEVLKDEYNNRFNTDYKNIISVFIDAYFRVNKSVHRAADLLGINYTCIYRRLKKIGFNFQRPGGHNGPLIIDKIRVIHDARLKEMSTIELARAVGCTHQWINTLARRYNLTLKGYKDGEPSG